MLAALLPVPLAAVILLGGLVPADGPQAAWPVRPPVVVAGFAPPTLPWLAGHRGVDLAAVAGQQVYALAGGRVAFAGVVAGKPVVVVQHPGGLRSTYEPVTAGVSAGAPVRAGQSLGVVALAGGHCAGACVHVGLRRGADYLDPLSLLRRPVLKPSRTRPRADGPAGRRPEAARPRHGCSAGWW